MNKKRIATSVAAVATAAALLLGGTFAWQSVNQTALNEASDVINPGGRLHDDFYIDADGNYNSDIYVENFAEDTIYARVKLQEYMEIIVNQDIEGAEVVETVTGSKSLNDTPAAEEPTDNTSGYTYEYVTHYFDQENSTDKYWNWTMGAADSAEVYYMPTFNMNKDSLVADRNGMYVDRIGGISNRGQDQYEEWTTWAAGDFEEGTEIYDVDPNMVDEVGFDFENLQTYVDAENIAIVENAVHYAVAVGYTNGLISMSEWLALGEDEDKGSYWVYDTDGWVYWSSPIEEDETTGLLLDAIELDDVMDDTWYYAINTVGQFITADDLGKVDNTGFYADGETVSADALTLLESIGVDVSGEAAGDEGEGEEPEEPEDPYGFHHMLLSMNNENSSTGTFFDEGYLTPGDTIQFGVAAYYNNGETIEINSSNASWEIDAIEGELADGTTISEDGKLTVAENQGDLSVINVQVIFTDKDGVEHIKEMSILVSNKSIILSLTIDAGGPYYIDEEYSFTATATSISGEVVPMMWMYDISPVDMGSDLFAYSYTEPKFMAEDAGDYYLRAWAEYMPGQKAEIPVTVVEGGAADTTAPMVSSVEGDGLIYTYTIEDVSDADFPMTMNVYWASDENVYAEGVGALYSVEYTLSEDGTVVQTGHGTDAADASVTYENGIVTSTLNTAVTDAGFWGVTVTDASGNMGKLEDPLFVEPAIGCFVAGTQVQTVDGLVNIEDIKLGDMVYSIDLTTGAKVVSPVTWVQGTRYIDATYSIYAGGEKVVATYEHPFYVVGKEWVAAEDLTVGDKIKTVDGQVTITDIVYTELDAPVQVYNFTVDGTHNYLISAAGLLVHNIPGK